MTGEVVKFCNTLTHPDGLNDLQALDLSCMRACDARCNSGFECIAVGNNLRSLELELICEALTHPDGPKYLTALNLDSRQHLVFAIWHQLSSFG